MKAYHLYTVVPRLVSFLDNLSRWYVRFNKQRLKGDEDIDDTLLAMQILFEVLFQLCRLMAPFTPFLTERMYLTLRQALPSDQQQDSVHYLMLPNVLEEAKSPIIERKMQRLQQVMELGRQAREKAHVTYRTPLPECLVVHRDQSFLDDIKDLTNYIESESGLQVHKVTLTSNVDQWIQMGVVPDRFVRRNLFFVSSLFNLFWYCF